MKISTLSLLICFALFSINTEAQNKIRAFEFLGGYSTHGSGDMLGITFGGGYKTYLSKRFSLNYNMRAHINSSREKIIVNNVLVPGSRQDASVRFTTAGVQLGVNAGWSLIRTTQHEFMVSVGGFGRYQSASNGSDGYSLYFPATTGQPTVLVGYDNHTPQETITAGYIIQFHYNYTFKNNVFIGLLPGWQNDTNGDIITQVALTVGKRI